jgi:hypothetical protein
MTGLAEYATKRTEPSQNAKFAPPGCGDQKLDGLRLAIR